MSKSKRGAKGAGFDYDGRRSQRSTMMRGSHVKPLTHRRERRGEIRLIQQELEVLEEERAADRQAAYEEQLENDFGDVFLSDDLFEIFDESHEVITPRSSAYLQLIQRRLATPR